MRSIIKAHDVDPILFGQRLWPHVDFYDKEREIIYSVRDNIESYVPAGNMLGKDFTLGFICLWFFLTRHPCRIVTTSADYQQLQAVLWGEIRRFIQTSAIPLDVKHGGPLVINDMHIRKVVKGKMCGLSYIVGKVAAKGEGMLGHHIPDIGDDVPRTLFAADESSGIEDINYERASTWFKRMIAIGNCYEPSGGMNFFKRAVQAGDKVKKVA